MCVIFQVDRKTWLVTDELRESPTDGLTNWLRLGDVVYTPTERALCLTIFFFASRGAVWCTIVYSSSTSTWKSKHLARSFHLKIILHQHSILWHRRERERGTEHSDPVGIKRLCGRLSREKVDEWQPPLRRVCLFHTHIVAHRHTRDGGNLRQESSVGFCLGEGGKKRKFPSSSRLSKSFSILCVHVKMANRSSTRHGLSSWLFSFSLASFQPENETLYGPRLHSSWPGTKPNRTHFDF